MSTSPLKTAARETRFSIRANAAQKELLARAAHARNTDISKFVLGASLGKAKRLCRALDESGAPNAELQQLLR